MRVFRGNTFLGVKRLGNVNCTCRGYPGEQGDEQKYCSDTARAGFSKMPFHTCAVQPGARLLSIAFNQMCMVVSFESWHQATVL